MTARAAIGSLSRWPRWALISLAGLAVVLGGVLSGYVWASARGFPVLENRVCTLEKRADEDRTTNADRLKRIEQKVDQILERGR